MAMHSYMKMFGEQNGRWKHPAVGCRCVSLHFKRMYLFEFTVTCGMTCCRLGAWPLLTSPRTAEPMLMADDAHPKPHQWGAVDGSEIHHQLRLAVYPIIYRVLYMPGGWPWDFWTINSMFKTKNSLGKQLGHWRWAVSAKCSRKSGS